MSHNERLAAALKKPLIAAILITRQGPQSPWERCGWNSVTRRGARAFQTAKDCSHPVYAPRGAVLVVIRLMEAVGAGRRTQDASGGGHHAPGDDDHIGTTCDIDIDQSLLRIHLE